MQRGAQIARRDLGVTSASAGSKNVKKPFKNNGLAHLGGTFLEAPNWTLKIRKAFPCSVALVSFCTGAFPCSVALVFQFWMFQWVVQHGLSEGVRNVIKIIVFDDF